MDLLQYRNLANLPYRKFHTNPNNISAEADTVSRPSLGRIACENTHMKANFVMNWAGQVLIAVGSVAARRRAPGGGVERGNGTNWNWDMN